MASYCANLIGNWSSQMFIDTIVQKGRAAPSSIEQNKIYRNATREKFSLSKIEEGLAPALRLIFLLRFKPFQIIKILFCHSVSDAKAKEQQ